MKVSDPSLNKPSDYSNVRLEMFELEGDGEYHIKYDTLDTFLANYTKMGHDADPHTELVDTDEFDIRSSANGFSLRKLSLATLKAFFENIFTSRATIEVAVSGGNLTLDCNSKKEVVARKTGGGAVVISANIGFLYSNDSNLVTAWIPVEVTGATRTITFPASHISSDSRFASLILTLEVGTYQISIMNDGVKRHILCSEAEV